MIIYVKIKTAEYVQQEIQKQEVNVDFKTSITGWIAISARDMFKYLKMKNMMMKKNQHPEA